MRALMTFSLLFSLTAGPSIASAQATGIEPEPGSAADDEPAEEDAIEDGWDPAAGPASDEPSEDGSYEEERAREEDEEDEQPEQQDEDEEGWLDNLSGRVFVDGYAAGHWTLPNPLHGDHSAQIPHRAFDVDAGFDLAFVGLDISYEADPIGATVNLRFGTAVPRLIGSLFGLPEGLQFLKQAFVSALVIPEVRIDFGEFDTIYGAEVSESWLNQNYTRGSLYNLVQPFYHAGFRMVVTATDWLTLTGLAVNGWNSVVDNNDGKSGGLQARFAVGEFALTLGYLLGPEQAPTGIDDADARLRHLVDVVVSFEVDELALVGNFDLVVEDVGGGTYDTLWGVMIGARYRPIPEFALALRGEYVGDPDVDADAGRDLFTLTLTLDAQPVSHLVIRLDSRIDVASDPRFPDPAGNPSQLVFSTVLGLVVHSD